MCAIDNSDGSVTMIRESTPKARKTYKCAECARHILPGERYCREYYAFDGETKDHKTCAHCLVARGWLMAECGGWLYGGVEEDLREHAQDSYYGRAVQRLAVGMSWRWRAPSGRMLPVPTAPQTSFELRQQQKGSP